MAGVNASDNACCKIELADPCGDEHACAVVAAKGVVRLADDLVDWFAGLGNALDCRLGAHHEKRCAYTFAADIGDKERDVPGACEVEVVKIAADLLGCEHITEYVDSRFVGERRERTRDRIILNVCGKAQFLCMLRGELRTDIARDHKPDEECSENEGDRVQERACRDKYAPLDYSGPARNGDIDGKALYYALGAEHVRSGFLPLPAFVRRVWVRNNRAVGSGDYDAAVVAAHVTAVRETGDGGTGKVGDALAAPADLHETAFREPHAHVFDHITAQRVRQQRLGEFIVRIEKSCKFTRLPFRLAKVESADFLATRTVGE